MGRYGNCVASDMIIIVYQGLLLFNNFQKLLLVRKHDIIQVHLIQNMWKVYVNTFLRIQVKETRKAVRDSERGVEKMSVGHHIRDRAHIIEKSRGRDGNVDENQELINLDESKRSYGIIILITCTVKPALKTTWFKRPPFYKDHFNFLPMCFPLKWPWFQGPAV